MKDYYLSVLAIFKNESHIFKEWIMHYLAEGVDHFFLINNFSTDDFNSVLDEFRYCIDIYDSSIPNDQLKNPQENNYKYVYDNYVKGRTEWLIVVDLDEFMYATVGTIKNELGKIDGLNCEIAQLRIAWKLFGSNGFINQPKSVVKNFVQRVSFLNGFESLLKNIFKPDATENFTAHDVFLKPNFKFINVSGFPYKNYSLIITEESISSSVIQLNHYRLQSKEYWEKIKMNRGDVAGDMGSNFYRSLEFFETRNTVENSTNDEDLYKKHKNIYDSIDCN